MAFTRYLTVALGSSKADLTTVGYRLYDSDGDAVGSRVTLSIQDLEGGQYGATVEFPDDFTGRITWDSGEITPVYASASVNPEDENTTTLLTKMEELESNVGTVLDPTFSGISTTPGSVMQRVVRAGIPDLDGCQILTRIKAFINYQGVTSILEHTFRDRTGNPVDLSEWLSTEESESVSSSAQPTGSVALRVKEWLGEGANSVNNPIWEVVGSAYAPEQGVIRARLTKSMVERCGIYELSWAILDSEGEPIAVDRGIMSIERSLFPSDLSTLYKNQGPPTIQEIRMMMMDSAANENTLLDDVEFRDEQLLLAMTKPVQLWNETPPPIKCFTTRNFPFRGAWVTGIMAQLHLMAANHYRRNFLKGSAGGVEQQDKNKEREYMAEGQRLWEEYKTWLGNKKVSINMRNFWSSNLSGYSSRRGW